MRKINSGWVVSAILFIALVAMMAIFATVLHTQSPPKVQVRRQDRATETGTPTALPSATPQAATLSPTPTAMPTHTLLPPPTFEPPTATPLPSATPSDTPTPNVTVDVSIPGLHGAETPTPSTTPGCKPRTDWKLTYQVQPNDALDRIAARYGTDRWTLAEANCIRDPNLIVVGQQLRVPGDAQPQEAIECVPWQLFTPVDGTVAVPGVGQITFNWYGPRSPRNLIRVIRPDGSKFERTIELRQNETVDIASNFHAGGTYTWYVYPLDPYFRQIACKEGGPWHFTKPESPPPTPTPVALPNVSMPTGP